MGRKLRRFSIGDVDVLDEQILIGKSHIHEGGKKGFRAYVEFSPQSPCDPGSRVAEKMFLRSEQRLQAFNERGDFYRLFVSGGTCFISVACSAASLSHSSSLLHSVSIAYRTERVRTRFQRFCFGRSRCRYSRPYFSQLL